MKYLEMTFGGHIVYSRTVYEVEEATKDLLNFVQAKKKQAGRAVLGFDIEWKPSFKRGGNFKMKFLLVMILFCLLEILPLPCNLTQNAGSLFFFNLLFWGAFRIRSLR